MVQFIKVENTEQERTRKSISKTKYKSTYLSKGCTRNGVGESESKERWREIVNEVRALNEL